MTRIQWNAPGLISWQVCQAWFVNSGRIDATIIGYVMYNVDGELVAKVAMPRVTLNWIKRVYVPHQNI